MPVENSFLAWDEVLRFGTVAAVVWTAAAFLYKQQISIKDLVYRKAEDIKKHFSDKLEYHERHDDQRFDNIRKDIIDLRISQARQYKYLKENGNGKNVNPS